jgi:hypothetical protein
MSLRIALHLTTIGPLFELCARSGNVAAAQLLVEHKADIMDTDVRLPDSSISLN